MAYNFQEIVHQWMNKDFLFWVNRPNRESFLLQNNGEQMKNQYLGACLDYARVGATNACFWNVGEGGIKGLISYIDTWMKQNKDNLIWSDKPSRQELPRINYEVCPRNAEHTSNRFVKDEAGRTRCAEIESVPAKPSFVHAHTAFNPYSMMDHTSFVKVEHPRNEEEFDAYCSEELVHIIDACYSIISEPKELILPLEKVLKRLNIQRETDIHYCNRFSNCEEDKIRPCTGHTRPHLSVGYPFDGWTLAEYVQKWHEQTSADQAPIFSKPEEKDTYKKWPNFQIQSSDS